MSQEQQVLMKKYVAQVEKCEKAEEKVLSLKRESVIELLSKKCAVVKQDGSKSRSAVRKASDSSKRHKAKLRKLEEEVKRAAPELLATGAPYFPGILSRNIGAAATPPSTMHGGRVQFPTRSSPLAAPHSPPITSPMSAVGTPATTSGLIMEGNKKKTKPKVANSKESKTKKSPKAPKQPKKPRAPKPKKVLPPQPPPDPNAPRKWCTLDTHSQYRHPCGGDRELVKNIDPEGSKKPKIFQINLHRIPKDLQQKFEPYFKQHARTATRKHCRCENCQNVYENKRALRGVILFCMVRAGFYNCITSSPASTTAPTDANLKDWKQQLLKQYKDFDPLLPAELIRLGQTKSMWPVRLLVTMAGGEKAGETSSAARMRGLSVMAKGFKEFFENDNLGDLVRASPGPPKKVRGSSASKAKTAIGKDSTASNGSSDGSSGTDSNTTTTIAKATVDTKNITTATGNDAVLKYDSGVRSIAPGGKEENSVKSPLSVTNVGVQLNEELTGKRKQPVMDSDLGPRKRAKSGEEGGEAYMSYSI